MRKLLLLLVSLALLAGTAVSASAAPADQRQTIVVAVRTSDGVNTCQVGATGPIHGAGTCGFEFKYGLNLFLLVFPNGTVDLLATAEHETDHSSPCLHTARFTGSYEILGGSGAYAGASGSGTISGQSAEVSKICGGVSRAVFVFTASGSAIIGGPISG
ncbi:MAG: hypothetical protein ACR2LX_09665 [Jatrophihabitans sp.]